MTKEELLEKLTDIEWDDFECKESNLKTIIKQWEPQVQKTVDIHPPKTGISVHFSDSFILMALQI